MRTKFLRFVGKLVNSSDGILAVSSICVLVSGSVHLLVALVYGGMGITPDKVQGVIAAVVAFMLMVLLAATVVTMLKNLSRDNFSGSIKLVVFIGISAGMTVWTTVMLFLFPQSPMLWTANWVPVINVILFFVLLALLQG